MNAINLTMAAALAVLYSVGFFLLMQRSLMRVLLGIVVLGHVANLHRDLKAAELNYEDEKFSYVLATRPGDPPQPPAAPADRVLRHPLTRKGLVQFRVCSPDGAAHDRIVSKRQGELYRQARDTRWGDTLPSQRT